MDLTVKVRMLGNYAVLQATEEADDVARKNASRKLVARSKDPAIVEREGRDKLLSSGGVVSEMNILRCTEIQFGLYRGQFSVDSGKRCGMGSWFS